jgi:hypothetical protein
MTALKKSTWTPRASAAGASLLSSPLLSPDRAGASLGNKQAPVGLRPTKAPAGLRPAPHAVFFSSTPELEYLAEKIENVLGADGGFMTLGTVQTEAAGIPFGGNNGEVKGMCEPAGDFNKALGLLYRQGKVIYSQRNGRVTVAGNNEWSRAARTASPRRVFEVEEE